MFGKFKDKLKGWLKSSSEKVEETAEVVKTKENKKDIEKKEIKDKKRKEKQEKLKKESEELKVKEKELKDQLKAEKQKLKKLEEKKFELALIDVRFVEEQVYNVEGLDLMRFIKKNYRKTKIIILTGYHKSIGYSKPNEADEFIITVPDDLNFIDEFQNKIRLLLKQT